MEIDPAHPMPGVLVRAHMVAQLIDGSRPIFDLDPGACNCS